MSRRQWIKPSVKKLIADEAYNNPKEPRLALYVRLKKMIEEMGELPPSEETTLKLISDGRRTPRKFSVSWTMATLRDDELPPESIPWVLKVWRYSINTGETFSIGHAQWVSRLYSMFSEISVLWYWSFLYANEERLSIVLNEEMDTYNIDSAIILSSWEKDTLFRTDFHDKPFKYGFERLLYKHKDGNISEEILHFIKPTNPWRDDYSNERDDKLSRLVRDLPSLSSLNMNEETKMVYFRWLDFLTNGIKWNSLSPESARNVIVRLRELIIKEYEHRMSDDFKNSMDEVFNMSSHPFKSGMIEILNEAGYKYTQKQEEESSPEWQKLKQELRAKNSFQIRRKK